jgi:FMN phosphatase YigB (HAD superfamily)
LLLPLSVTNTGTETEDTALSLDLPPGWSGRTLLDGAYAELASMQPGQSMRWTAVVASPPEARAGDYVLRAILSGRSGASAIATFTAAVDRTFDLLQSFGERLANPLFEGALVSLGVRAKGFESDKRGMMTDGVHGNATADIPATALKFKKTLIGKYFDAVLTSFDTGYPKEDRKFWEVAEKRLGFYKEKTLFIDDTEEILKTAKKFGIKYILYKARANSKVKPGRSNDFMHIIDFDELL